MFCSQDCFKEAWSEHKKVHQKPVSDGWMFVTKRGRGRAKAMPSYNYNGKLRPYPVSPTSEVPESIPRPEYAANGEPINEMRSRAQNSVPIYTPKQIAGIRKACLLARQILDKAHAAVRPGVTTDEIDKVVHAATVEAGAYPSPLNYWNFPKSVCTSVNEVICHGIPDQRPLEAGDIVNVDVTAYYKGYHGDLNETFVVGEVDEESKKLTKVAYECLMQAIAAVKPGVRYREMGAIISKHAESNGLSVVKTYCGHGIGEWFHCAPNIPHYRGNKAVGTMKEGQVFTIEPMINVGTWRDQTWPDGWTATTADGKRSAQFEHTLVVTASGCDVLTARLPESPPLWWEAGAAKQPADGQPQHESDVTAQLQQQHLNGSAGTAQGSAAAAERTS